MSEDALSNAIVSEAVFNQNYYQDFASETPRYCELVKCKYVFNKQYNTNTGNFLIPAVCNALQTEIQIYKKTCDVHYTVTQHPPGHPGVK